ncbi:hypothetical protein [Micromonospora sp. 4G55]|uniref:hypothetical protein n=1 Tax=Micromonospora sp. 4G55 TaxID=2806102 RepID=UPI001EE3C089
MIPEEDRPASWLRDYGGIEADIRQMSEFADRLQAEVERNYAPHLSYIADDMRAPVPNPCDAFVELVQFLHAHWETQQATANMVHDLGGAPATWPPRPAGSPPTTGAPTRSPRPGSPTWRRRSPTRTPRCPVAGRLPDPTGPNGGPVVLP